MSGHFLFQGAAPPPLPPNAAVDDACIWLLVVMNAQDPSRRFVASLLNYHSEHGYLTEKQVDALSSLSLKISRHFAAGNLEILGGGPARSQRVGLGVVVPFSELIEENERVIE